MANFLDKLYSYEYFGIYLMISIIVLVLLFIVILFFGKKDQKEREIEATKKLQQINNDAFKDDSIMEKVEVEDNNLTQAQLENDTIIVPSIDDVPSINNVEVNEIPEPVLPTEEAPIENPINDIPVVESPIINEEPINIEIPVQPVSEQPVVEENPILEKIEEKPLAFSELFIAEDAKVEIPKFEEPIKSEPVAEEIEVPSFNFDEIVQSVEETKKEQTYTKGPEIFSSVYAPEKEAVELPKSPSEDLGIELPSLKKEEPVEEKQEEKIEMPVLNDYNLDNLSGETYNIK